jgi:hypothetical protein
VHIVVHVETDIVIPIKVADYMTDEDAEDPDMNGLCIGQYAFDTLHVVEPGEVVHRQSFSPSTDGHHLDATMVISHRHTLGRFRLVFPSTLRSSDPKDTVSVQFSREVEEVVWNGDRWVMPGWGPQHCPHCAHPAFTSEIASDRRDLSAHIPTFAPSTFYDAHHDAYHCPLSGRGERHEGFGFGDLRVHFRVGRPGHEESTETFTFRFPPK